MAERLATPKQPGGDVGSSKNPGNKRRRASRGRTQHDPAQHRKRHRVRGVKTGACFSVTFWDQESLKEEEQRGGFGAPTTIGVKKKRDRTVEKLVSLIKPSNRLAGNQGQKFEREGKDRLSAYKIQEKSHLRSV